MNFDETELKSKSDHTYNDKIKLFRENILVIEEELFDYMNLTICETFEMIATGASIRSPRQRNIPYGQMVTRYIYDTRRPKHPHLPIRRYERRP